MIYEQLQRCGTFASTRGLASSRSRLYSPAKLAGFFLLVLMVFGVCTTTLRASDFSYDFDGYRIPTTEERILLNFWNLATHIAEDDAVLRTQYGREHDPDHQGSSYTACLLNQQLAAFWENITAHTQHHRNLLPGGFSLRYIPYFVTGRRRQIALVGFIVDVADILGDTLAQKKNERVFNVFKVQPTTQQLGKNKRKLSRAEEPAVQRCLCDTGPGPMHWLAMIDEPLPLAAYVNYKKDMPNFNLFELPQHLDAEEQQADVGFLAKPPLQWPDQELVQEHRPKLAAVETYIFALQHHEQRKSKKQRKRSLSERRLPKTLRWHVPSRAKRQKTLIENSRAAQEPAKNHYSDDDEHPIGLDVAVAPDMAIHPLPTFEDYIPPELLALTDELP